MAWGGVGFDGQYAHGVGGPEFGRVGPFTHVGQALVFEQAPSLEAGHSTGALGELSGCGRRQRLACVLFHSRGADILLWGADADWLPASGLGWFS